MFHLATAIQPFALKLPDTRLNKRYKKIDKLLLEGQSSILNKISTDRAERKGGYDFFKNPRVTELNLCEQVYSKLEEKKESLTGEHLLVLQDTSEYNYYHQAGRLKDKNGLGRLSDKAGYGIGFLVHPSLVLNAKTQAIIGLSDIQIWHRKEDRAKTNTRKQRDFEDKESYKWHVGIANSQERLKEARLVTHVNDSEGDIYESIVKIEQMEKTELITRGCQDRRIQLENGEITMLFGHLEKQEVLFSYSVKVKEDKRKKRKKRIAKLDVRCVRVKLICPDRLKKKNLKFAEVDVVWVRENPSSVPKDGKAIDWKLITTHKVLGDDQAIKQIVEWYSGRWLIEEFFLSQKQEPTI